MSQIHPRSSESDRYRRQFGPHTEELSSDTGQRQADQLHEPPCGAGGPPASHRGTQQHVVQQGRAGEVQTELGPLHYPPERQGTVGREGGGRCLVKPSNGFSFAGPCFFGDITLTAG